MIADTLELLDRQLHFMLRQSDLDLLRNLPRYLALISRDTRVANAMAGFREDAIKTLGDFTTQRESIAAEVRKLHDEFLREYPQEEDSVRFEHVAQDTAEWRALSKLSSRNFEELTQDVRALWPDLRKPDREDKLAEAIKLLAERLSRVLNTDESVAPLLRAVNTQRERLATVRRHYDLKCFASAGVATIRVCAQAASLTPEPKVFDQPRKIRDLLEYALRGYHSYSEIALRYLFGERSTKEEAGFREFAEALRADLALFHEEVRAELGLTQSMLAHVKRFKHVGSGNFGGLRSGNFGG